MIKIVGYPADLNDEDSDKNYWMCSGEVQMDVFTNFELYSLNDVKNSSGMEGGALIK